MPSIGTSGLNIVANKCLPDSVCKELWKAFNKSVCEETGSGSMSMNATGANFMVDNSHTWNDTLGCITKDEYSMRINDGPWVVISKCLYFWYNKNTTSCSKSNDTGGIVEYPCCGHIHKTKPD